MVKSGDPRTPGVGRNPEPKVSPSTTGRSRGFLVQGKINRLPDQTIKITLSLPWQEIKQEYEGALKSASQTIEIKGFRQGKAPKKLVEEKINKQLIYQRIIQKLVPSAYAQAIKEHQVKPIVNPQIKALSLEENKDWQFEAETCEAPRIELGQYQAAVSKINAHEKIWTPGKELKTDSKEKDSPTPQKINQRLSQIFATLLETVKINLPQILVQIETDRLLSQLLDEIKRLGLTLDSYLSSRNLTPEQLRAQYQKGAEENLKLEFILAQIADDLKVQIKPEEIEELIKKSSDEKAKKQLAGQKYQLALILRRRKTVDKLLSL